MGSFVALDMETTRRQATGKRQVRGKSFSHIFLVLFEKMLQKRGTDFFFPGASLIPEKFVAAAAASIATHAANNPPTTERTEKTERREREEGSLLAHTLTVCTTKTRARKEEKKLCVSSL